MSARGLPRPLTSLPVLCFETHVAIPSFLHGTGQLNLGSHAGAAGTLATEPSLHAPSPF